MQILVRVVYKVFSVKIDLRGLLHLTDLCFAIRMQRKKGQFTSSKSISDEAGSSSAEGNVGSSQEEPETS